MTRDEYQLISEIVKDHPARQFFDGKKRADYIPSAREALIMLGKSLPDGSLNKEERK